MKATRARFKYVLRQCKKVQETNRSDALARDLSTNDITGFWKKVKRNNNSVLSNKIDGATGDDAIADKWKCHYKNLLNSVGPC